MRSWVGSRAGAPWDSLPAKRRLLAVGQKMTGTARRVREHTRALALLAGTSVAVVVGSEFARIWRLGRLPSHRGASDRSTASRFVYILREGTRVTLTHENALFTMLGSFAVTFGFARGVTYAVRTRGAIGPMRDIRIGTRHIHHFIPGVLIGFASGGAAIASRKPKLNQVLAVPFGVGAALVLDEAALMLELEDVYWAEEGLLSIDIAFGAICLLSSLAYLIRVIRRGEARARENDWAVAARAWKELQALPGANPPRDRDR